MALKAYQPTLNEAAPRDEKFSLAEHVGTLVAFQVIAHNPQANTQHGVKPEVTVDVTILDGVAAGKDYGNAKVWATSIVKDLSTEVGETVVARIGQWRSATASGYELYAPTSADMDTANAHFIF